MGHAPQVLAILNNIVVGLVARQGKTNLAEARRKFAYQLERDFSSLAALGALFSRRTTLQQPRVLQPAP